MQYEMIVNLEACGVENASLEAVCCLVVQSNKKLLYMINEMML